MWLCHTVSLSPVGIVSRNPFSVFSEGSTSIHLQKGRRKKSVGREGCALLYHVTCCQKTLYPNYRESKCVWVSRLWIKSLPSRCAASPKKIKHSNNRGGQQQQCLSSSNQVVIRKHKKAKNTTINHQNGGGGHVWLLEKGPMF